MSAHTTPTTTVRHNVGTCPACRDYLWADVDLIAKVSPPTLTTDGKPSVYATAHAVGMRLAHECTASEDDA